MKNIYTVPSIMILLAFFLHDVSYSQGNATNVTVTTVSGNLTTVFDQYFLPRTLRIDYVMAGNWRETTVYLTQMKQEPFWGGSRKRTIDSFIPISNQA